MRETMEHFSTEENETENRPEVGRREKGSEIEDAQKILESEFGIPAGESEEIIEKNVEEVVDSPTFLEKIRNNAFIRNALKVIILTFALMRAEPALGQTNIEHGKTEQIQEKGRYEINQNLLLEGEYVVPEKVMIAFGEAVDPNMIGTPAGGFFTKSYLNTREKQRTFSSKLNVMGYTKEEQKTFESYFENKNIVFSENELHKERFRDILAHERLHKEVDNLSPEIQTTLNEARDFILNDFKEKQVEWEKESGLLLSMEAVHKAGPILLDRDGKTDGLMPILMNANEFYPYLMMNKLQPSVTGYLETNFPESYKIFENLKQGIYRQIGEKEVEQTP